MDALYPPRCPLCGAALAEQGGLCSECWSGLEVISPAEHEAEPGGVLAATVYNEVSRGLVLSLKRGRRIALARLLARMMAGRLPAAATAGAPPLLVPVPLHRLRLWERGFNQSALIARELARLGRGEVVVDALVRRRRTPSLAGLGSAERERALSGAITVRGSRIHRLAGRRIVLVDDVYTSGATTRACLAALAPVGAKRIDIVCFAQVRYGRACADETIIAADHAVQKRNARSYKAPGAA